MAVKRVSKEALIGETILFVNSDKENELESISPSFMSNQIDIISLDGLKGSPALPTAGTFNIYARTDIDGGFKLVTTNSSMSAIRAGGSLLDDGVAEGATFIGFPLEIKIVPVGVDVAIAYRVDIKQSSVQLDTPNLSSDYSAEMAKGNVPGSSPRAIIMRNPSCSNTDFTDIWGGGGATHDNMIMPTVAESWEVLSDSDDDIAGGAGCRSVLVTTLDDDYGPQVPEIVDMDGQNPVAIPGTHFRPHHLTSTSGLFALTAGPVGGNPHESNIGTIIVRRVSDGAIRMTMLPEFGKSEDSQVSVPAGFTLLTWKAIITWSKGQDGQVVSTVKPFGTDTARISSGKVDSYQTPLVLDFQMKFRSGEKTDRVARAKSSNDGAEVTFIQEFELIDNNFL